MTTATPPRFVLDANVFIEAHRRYYALDLCPGFWDCLAHFSRESTLVSIDRVRAEMSGADVLSDWVNQAPAEMFDSTADVQMVDLFAQIMVWVQGQTQFGEAAKAQFAAAADGWVAAYAAVHRAVVVTHEVYNPTTRRKLPLPNVCRQFGIVTCDTFVMLREREVRFGWLRV